MQDRRTYFGLLAIIMVAVPISLGMNTNSLCCTSTSASDGASSAVEAYTDNGENNKALYREPPAELQKQIVDRVSLLAKGCALSQADARSLTEQVGKLPIIGPGKEARAAVKAAGYGAIAVLEQLLLSPDESTRRRAIRAIGFFVKMREHVSEYPQGAEQALIAVVRRSLFDRNTMVRYDAIGLLYQMGRAHHRKIPEEIETALAETAASDPDGERRTNAQYALEDLGLAPRSPGRPWIE